MSATQGQAPAEARVVRCAIYTRKSTQEGLDMDFNTLDAQREAAEFYIRAMRSEGWVALEERYDDGGFTGANTERPALQRLLADIAAGRIDCVVVYKVDRLSRSLLDFANLLALFDTHNVSFVSTTQHFNTRDAMGRLTLNIVVSFAQFEREMIADRTRDKMAASRKRGKWLGSLPVLGYDGDRGAGKLVVNEEEAEQVRAIFGLYLRLRSAPAVADALNERGWLTKRNVAATGSVLGGRPWTRGKVTHLLRDQQYVGKVVYRDQAYEGEQAAIVPQALFDKVQRLLDDQSGGRGARRGRRPEFLLLGVLRCGVCGSTMTSATSTGRKRQQHRYYVCSKRARAATACIQGRVAAVALEDLVAERLRARCASTDVREQLATHMQRVGPALVAQHTRERDALDAQRTVLRDEATQLLAASPVPGEMVAGRLAEIDRRLAALRPAIDALDAKLTELRAASDLAQQVAEILVVFDRAWAEFTPAERCDLVKLVIDRVVVHEPEGKVDITYHDLATGLGSGPGDGLPALVAGGDLAQAEGDKVPALGSDEVAQ